MSSRASTGQMFVKDSSVIYTNTLQSTGSRRLRIRIWREGTRTMLVQAIREATVSIVLISKNYASSRWCLDELVEILKCKEASGQIVMPVFYHVDPYHVRKQKGDFGIAFEKNCKGRTEKQKRKWSKALACVAEIAGEHSRNWTDEAAMLEKLSTDVSNKLKVVELNELFNSADIDQDGFVTAAELRFAMTKDGGKVTDEQVSIIIRTADVDGDGRINYDEFVKFMTAKKINEEAEDANSISHQTSDGSDVISESVNIVGDIIDDVLDILFGD